MGLATLFRHPPYGHVIKLRVCGECRAAHRPTGPGILATAVFLSPEVDELTIQLPSLLLVVGAVSLPLKCEYFL